MRKTKIVCTIGHTCNNEETLKRMCLSCGDRIVITGGLTNGLSGNTDIIKVESISGKGVRASKI